MNSKMKALTTYTLIALMALATVSHATVRDGGAENVFVFKADKRFMGAKVEIYSATGQLITAQTVDKKKMMIDFGDVRKGVYVIRLVKGEDRQEFRYEKR